MGSREEHRIPGLLLPVELTDMIIAYVDRRSLCDCALVCQDWVPASRYHLFRRVSIRSARSYDLLVTRVLRNEELRPWLTSVRAFKIDNSRPGTSLSTDPSWTRRFVHDFAGNLPDLGRLEFVGVDWARYTPHPSAFLTFSQFPSVDALLLRNCHFPSFRALRSIVVSMPSLTALTMDNVFLPSTLPHLPMLDHPYHGRGPSLSSLDIEYRRIHSGHQTGVASFLRWLSQSPSQQTLRALTFYPGASFVPGQHGSSGIVDFLRAVGPSLERLTTANFLGAFPPPTFVNLKELTISAHKLNQRSITTWEDLVPTLRNLPHGIRRLRIQDIVPRMFGIEPFASSSQNPNPSPESRATPGSLNPVATPSELADRLLAREDLHALENVEFVVKDPSRRIGKAACQDVLARMFPLLHARPGVQVMVSMESG